MTPTTTVNLESGPITLERPSVRKSNRALALIRALSKKAPRIQTELARFRRDYEAENVVELDRAQARLEYPPRPLSRNGELLREPELLPSGEPNPRAGEPVFEPSPIDHMSEADWERADHKLRVPRSPSTEEEVFAVLDVALEEAEDLVYRLLALFTLSNEDVKTAWAGSGFDALLSERVEWLMDNVYGDEVLELAAAAAEVVDEHFIRKASAMGDRLGKLRSLFGRTPRSETPTPSSPSPATPPPSSEPPAPPTPPSPTPTPTPTPEPTPPAPSSSPSTSSSTSSSSQPETGSENENTPSEPSMAESLV